MASSQFGDPPIDLLPQNRLAVRPGQAFAQVPQHRQLVAAGAIGVVARHFVRKRVIAGKDGGEDHAGIVAQGVGQPPPLWELRALAGALVAHGQGDARIAQRVDAGSRWPGW